MILEDMVEGAKIKFDKLGLKPENVTKIYNYIDKVATELKDQNSSNWSLTYLLTNIVNLSRKGGWSVSESLVMRTFDLFEANYQSEYNLDQLHDTLDYVCSSCRRYGDSKLLEKTVDTLTLYKDKQGFGAVAKFIGDQACELLEIDDEHYSYETLLELFSKEEFVTVFSRFKNFKNLDCDINEMIMEGLRMSASQTMQGSWYCDFDLVKVLSSYEMGTLMGSTHLGLDHQTAIFLTRYSKFKAIYVHDFVRLVSEHYHHAGGHKGLFYYAVDEISNVVNQIDGYKEGAQIFKIIFDEKVLAKFKSIGKTYYVGNVAKCVASVATDVKDLETVKDVVNLAESYFNAKEGLKQILQTIAQVSAKTQNYKDTRRVCDLGNFYLGKKDSVFAFSLVSKIAKEDKWNISIGSEKKGLIEAVTKGLMKFEDCTIPGIIKNSLEIASELATERESLVKTLDVLTLYQNYNAIDLVCDVVDRSFEINYERRDKVLDCLILYVNCDAKNDIFSGLNFLLEDARLLSNEIERRTNTLLHPAVIENIGNYENKEFLYDVLDNLSDIEEVSSENLKSLMKNIYDRSKDFVKHSIMLGYFYSNVYFKIEDKEVADNLSINEINNLLDVFDVTLDISQKWSEKYQQVAYDGFFQTLNSKLETGTTLDSKRKILREWCYNAYQGIVNNAPDLQFTELNQYFQQDFQQGVSVA